MPKFKVEAHSKHAPKETYSKIKGFLSQDKDLRKMDAAYACEFDDAKLSGQATGKQFEAKMKVVAKGDGSHVEIEVSLPLLLTPVKGMVQSTLQKKLDLTLA
jgi:hypothetical protein